MTVLVLRLLLLLLALVKTDGAEESEFFVEVGSTVYDDDDDDDDGAAATETSSVIGYYEETTTSFCEASHRSKTHVHRLKVINHSASFNLTKHFDMGWYCDMRVIYFGQNLDSGRNWTFLECEKRTCRAFYEMFNITWTPDEGTILHFVNVSHSDNGFYKVIVSNAEDSDSVVLFLYVSPHLSVYLPNGECRDNTVSGFAYDSCSGSLLSLCILIPVLSLVVPVVIVSVYVMFFRKNSRSGFKMIDDYATSVV
ncbi:ORF10 [red squirrel adenovirus 1]|uniref:ORF10 n=1 Tax=red squirrel adenovirus 1 TaxID=2773314 RepID=A0A220A478_9ADEN|nr:ORF10 [red squirrel adenovirus 1]ARE31903.1 ORF10 [red squirrel adenovirus 1]